MALQQLNTTELDFDKIKENIRTYFKRQDSAYKDWDFEGSSLGLLLDVLAYNTHYNAVLAHMSINESFIDSAQIRKNVVSHAKLVGYTPRSAQAPEAEIALTIQPGGQGLSHTIPKGRQFTTIVDDVTYTFITLEDYTASRAAVTDSYYFNKANKNSIFIREGFIQTASYSVNNSLPSQKFVIDEINADISSLAVRVRDHINSNTYTSLTLYGLAPYKTLENLNEDSLVFFLYENIFGRYEVSLGNGIFGKLPGNLNIVELEYIVTSGAAANYANAFTMTTGGSATVTTLSVASGGGEREGIESIRFNAPISIITQNRAVTADDYRSLILRDNPNIQTINVWGGEDASPPEYGKVFITIKPKAASQLTDLDKASILALLQEKKVLTITPVFVDVDFTYIYLDVYFKFNSTLTQFRETELSSIVRSNIKNFNITELQEFDNVFRYSKLLKTIDNSNPSILNSFAQIYLYKKIQLYAYEPKNIVLDFNVAPYIDSTSSLTNSIISSDLFMFNGETVMLSDEIDPSNSYIRNVYMHNASNLRLSNSSGKFNITTGVISLTLISTDEDIEIRVYMEPVSYDLAPSRNQLLVIDSDNSTVIGSIDTIAVSGTAGAANYTTYTRK